MTTADYCWATLIGFVALCYSYALGKDFLRALFTMKEQHQPRYVYQDPREQKIIAEDRDLRQWVFEVYPEVFKEWKSVYDIKESSNGS